MVADQQTAESIGVVADVALECLQFLGVGGQLWGRQHLVKLIEQLLYSLGVVGMLAHQTRVTRHLDAPFYRNGYGSIIEDSGWVVSSVLPSAQPPLSSYRATGKMGTRPQTSVSYQCL